MKNLSFLALFGLLSLTVACDAGLERENEIEREEAFESNEGGLLENDEGQLLENNDGEMFENEEEGIIEE